MYNLVTLKSRFTGWVTVCPSCEKTWLENLPAHIGYSVEKEIDFGTCTICDIDTIRKHLFLKSVNKRRK